MDDEESTDLTDSSSDELDDDGDHQVLLSRRRDTTRDDYVHERSSSFSQYDNLLLLNRRSSPSRHHLRQDSLDMDDENQEGRMSLFRIYYHFKEKLIGRIFYRHGLLCASHPWIVMFMSLVLFAIACYPILGVHLIHPSSSQTFITELNEVSFDGKQFHFKNLVSSTPPVRGEGSVIAQSTLAPLWFTNAAPFAFVQQIIIKSAVIPWNKNLILMDAIRAPLQQAFPVIDFLSSTQFSFSDNSSRSLMDFCLQVSEPASGSATKEFPFLPRYSCLVVSPANFWQNDRSRFMQDPSLIKTMHSVKDVSSPESSGNIREILFGVRWLDSGIRRLYLTTRQRTITYAVTLVLSKYDPEFIDLLSKSLKERYPSSLPQRNKVLDASSPSVLKTNQNIHHNNDNEHQPQQTENNNEHIYSSKKGQSKSTDGASSSASQEDVSQQRNKFQREGKHRSNVTHLFFQERVSYSEYLPLITTYALLFSYVLFFVRKVDLIKNKVGLAAGTLITGIMTYLMSLGICLWFDYNPTLYRIDALPYIVSIVCLENMLVLTKSVVSTPGHLDIRVRIAQGLSKEGFSLIRILSFELTLLTLGYFTYVPVIQECCLFGFVGLITDMFLQLTFFTTILSIDIQRIELDEKTVMRQSTNQHTRQGSELSRIRSNSMTNGPTNVFARPSRPIQFKMPKRLRLAYFWASTRIIHRTLMLGLVCWISYLMCKSGMTDNFTSHLQSHWKLARQYAHHQQLNHEFDTELNGQIVNQTVDEDPYRDDIIRLSEISKVLSLSTKHWESLFRCYNISLTRKYISILPPINLVIPVDPVTAVKTRHQTESDPRIFQQFLPGQLSLSEKSDTLKNEDDPLLSEQGIDSLDMESLLNYSAGKAGRWSRRDLWVAMGISIPSFTLLTYLVYVLYRCCCSRNYAEWRTSWSLFINASWKWIRRLGRKGKSRSGFMSESQFDAVPVKLTADAEEIEYISTCLESPFVATLDLQGDLTVWDALSGECHTLIRRSHHNMHFHQHHQMSQQQILPRLQTQSHPHQGMTAASSRSFRTNSFANSHPSSSMSFPFQASHRTTGSFSSDSTFASTTSEMSSASFVNLNSLTPDPVITCTTHSSVTPTSPPQTIASGPFSLAKKNGNQHRRHHSMSSISKIQNSSTAAFTSSSPQTQSSSRNNSRPYDFSPFAQKLNSSRELLTNLIRSAVASGSSSSSQEVTPANSTVDSPLNFKNVWTIELFGRFIYLGCENGRLEVWDALTGSLAYFHEKSSSSNSIQGPSVSTPLSLHSSNVSSSGKASSCSSQSESSGVTAIKVNNTRMIVSYLDGMMETYHLEPRNGLLPSSGFNSVSPSGSSFLTQGYRSMTTAASLVTNTALSDRVVSDTTASSSGLQSFMTFRPPSDAEPTGSSNAFFPRPEPTTTSSTSNVSESRCSTGTPFSVSNQLFYSLFHVVRAHRQPITVMELTGSHVITGSLDHTVKVHSLSPEGGRFTSGSSCLYTLHGHCGGITCIEVDRSCPSTAISGCQVGQVCVWDLQTGTCLFSLEAHPGSSVSAILPSPLYIVSSGTDDKMFIWDKYSGNLVHTIHQNHSLCKQMALLSPNILVTAKDDHLVLYDISEGSLVRIIDINESDTRTSATTATSTSPPNNSTNPGSSASSPSTETTTTGPSFSLQRNGLIKNLRVSSQSRSIVCDSGLHLSVIHFPGATEKYD